MVAGVLAQCVKNSPGNEESYSKIEEIRDGCGEEG
jgi:hypothetical protein